MASRMVWREKEVRLQLEEASEAMIRKAAFLVEQQAKVNIQQNGQIDTGFLVNSVYVNTPGQSTYGDAAAAAGAQDGQKGMSGERPAPADGAVVAVGAEYAIYQEERLPFLYPALESVAGRMAGEIVAAGREAIGE